VSNFAQIPPSARDHRSQTILISSDQNPAQQCRPTQMLTVDVVYLSQIGNLHSTNAFLIQMSRIQVEGAHGFVGVYNEHFLHHRRRRRNSRGCGLFRSAPLNNDSRSWLIEDAVRGK
jgi:hypothetical protein